MAIEIERKFLVPIFDKSNPDITEQLEITQGYITTDPDRTIRIRIIRIKGVFKPWKYSAFMTIKSQITHTSFSRNEWEFEMPVEIAEQLIHICVGSLHKTRYIIPTKNDRKFEIDVFHGNLEGLIVAEIELGSEDEEFDKPDWFGKEVTYDPRYLNSNLILNQVL
jgi:adenylate cyclase